MSGGAIGDSEGLQESRIEWGFMVSGLELSGDRSAALRVFRNLALSGDSGCQVVSSERTATGLRVEG